MACHPPRGSVMHVINAWVVSPADRTRHFQVEDTFKVGADSVCVNGLSPFPARGVGLVLGWQAGPGLRREGLQQIFDEDSDNDGDISALLT